MTVLAFLVSLPKSRRHGFLSTSIACLLLFHIAWLASAWPIFPDMALSLSKRPDCPASIALER